MHDEPRNAMLDEDGPIVFFMVMIGRNIDLVLIDQRSSTDVTFWDTFVDLQVSKGQLKPFDGVLIGFSGEQVEIRGYVDLKITFTSGQGASTIVVKYIVVNTPSLYYLLLGQPSLNKLN